MFTIKKENCFEWYDTKQFKKSESNGTQEEPVQVCLDTRDHIAFFSKFLLLERRIVSSPSQLGNDGMKLCNFSYCSARSILLLRSRTPQSKILVYYAPYLFESVQKFTKFEAEDFGLIF